MIGNKWQYTQQQNEATSKAHLEWNEMNALHGKHIIVQHTDDKYIVNQMMRTIEKCRQKKKALNGTEK